MTDTKKTKSKTKEESSDPGFNFSFMNSKEMFNMMQNCCGGDEGSFNCEEMMKKMFSDMPKEKETEEQ